MAQTNTSFSGAQTNSPSFLPPLGWKPIPSHREDRGMVKVVWLQGTPYQMGYQHGQLLHDEIATLPRWFITLLNLAAKHLGLAQFARQRSFPDVIDECAGLAAATADLGMTLESCLAIAFGDVFQQIIRDSISILLRYKVDVRTLLPALHLGCSQFIATGTATVDGHLYHADSLDCPYKPMQYWVKHSTIFVRQPLDGIPHVAIAVPGLIFPNSGLNACGISLALNSIHPARFREFSRFGRSHVQMMAQILKQARSYDEARAFILAQPQMKSDLIVVADGKSRQAGVFEITGQQTAVREINHQTDILYATNHFISPKMKHRDRPPSRSTLLRYQRLMQLLEPTSSHSYYGTIDVETMMNVLRDRINPDTFEESSLDIYDDNVSLATNGSMRQIVFDPEALQFWIAVGQIPVSAAPFLHFTFAELLNL